MFNLDITTGGRFCRRIGLKSSGPAALSFLKEWMAWEISLSVIHGMFGREMGGEEGGRGVMSIELPGKCSFTRISRDAVVEEVTEPSGSFIKPMELELNFFWTILDRSDADF